MCHGDLDVVQFEKDPDGDIGINIIRECRYESNIPVDYYDMRDSPTENEAALIY